MTTLDSTVAAVLDRQKNDASDDEDDLIKQLEEEEHDGAALDAFREQRLQQLHAEYQRAQTLRSAGDHGTYAEIKDEKALMDITTSSARLCVVHFFKPDFHRCSVMDAHLEQLAGKHFDTRFLRINVENASWLVARLKVQVLPCVIAFVDGVGVDRVIGFEGLSHQPDKFSTRDLEARLLKSGVLVRAKMLDSDSSTAGAARGTQTKQTEEDDDDDWD